MAKTRRKSTKPLLKTVKAIIEKKQLAIKLLEEVEQEMTLLADKYGEARFDYDLGEPDEEGKQYLKFEVIDNIEKLNRGETVFSQAVFKRVTFNSQMLKRIPESLK